MSNPYVTPERIEQEVREALAATLRIDAASIDMDTSIIQGLGATSIDFLDINFRLENVFGIQLATQMLLDHVEEEFGEGKAIDRENRVTPAAAELLKLHLGELPGLEPGMYADEVPATVTPRVVATGVARILETLPETCPGCGASAWKSDDGAKVVCGGCGQDAVYPSGDELTKRWIHDVEREKQLFTGA
jgi:acyl carrier protein/ribosomal protein S27AE